MESGSPLGPGPFESGEPEGLGPRRSPGSGETPRVDRRQELGSDPGADPGSESRRSPPRSDRGLSPFDPADSSLRDAELAATSFLRRSWNRVFDWYHCRIGDMYLRRGATSQAKDHFLAACERHPESFVAHLKLGRIYLDQQRIHLAKEELCRARDIDPQRFHQEKLPVGLTLWLAEQIPEFWSRRRVENLAPEGAEAPSAAGLAEVPADADEVQDLPFGDFSSREEAERFSLLPPIAISEVTELDWNELERLLREES